MSKPQLISRITERISNEISNHQDIKILKNHEVSVYIDHLITCVYMYTRPKKGPNKVATMSELISAIGHGCVGLFKHKKDSVLAARIGGFLLYSFEEAGIIKAEIGGGSNGHQQWLIKVENEDALNKLWATVNVEKSQKLPFFSPVPDWKSAKREDGAVLVKTGNKDVIGSLFAETHPLVFDSVNRAQKVGWLINKSLIGVAKWALRTKVEAFADIWEQVNPEAKVTKLREAKAIIDIADKIGDRVFYHQYYYDFRGRKYPTSAYLHEQGSDLARGLLLRKDSAILGESGFKWLCISIASNWAGDSGMYGGAKTDKIPLADRVMWVLENEDMLISFGQYPKKNQGWMKADSPWQFLAACIELYRIRLWQAETLEFNNFNIESNIEVYIDGSNNGSQHLAALTLDEETAPHVNLVPLKLPGDLYKYVADHVWETLSETLRNIAPEVFSAASQYVKTVTDYRRHIASTEPRSEERQKALAELKQFKADNQELEAVSAPVFWSSITDSKHKRKIVKRNVMTLPYGGTAYGLGEQQITDAKRHGIDKLLHMENKWGAYMGRMVYEDCRVSLKKPMRLLEVFEEAGRASEVRETFLSWNVPVTGFPVVQNYTEGIVKQVYVQYGPPKGPRLSSGYFENTLQLRICVLEEQVMSRGKQSQGAAPNIIHSLDAAHLTMTVNACDFPVTTIHDSFGCLAAHMDALYRITREQFVALYKTDPLKDLLSQIGGTLSAIQFGTLDIEDILRSEYAFA
jgi:hypothetical protein